MRYNVLEKDENGNDIIVNTIEAASAENVPWLRVVPVIEDLLKMLESIANSYLDTQARLSGYDNIAAMRLSVNTEAWHQDGVLGNTLYEKMWNYIFEAEARMKDNPENARQELDEFYKYCGQHLTIEALKKEFESEPHAET